MTINLFIKKDKRIKISRQQRNVLNKKLVSLLEMSYVQCVKEEQVKRKFQ